MRANKTRVLAWIMADEGGFVNDWRDPGGATNHGITARVLAAWRHVRSVSPATVRALSLPEAESIIDAQYLSAVNFDRLPSGLDYSVADAAVNSGPVQAIKWLQRALKIKADGHWGLVTQGAVAAITDVAALIDAYNGARLGFLRYLPTWRIFRGGWQRRVKSVDAKSHLLAKEAAAVV